MNVALVHKVFLFAIALVVVGVIHYLSLHHPWADKFSWMLCGAGGYALWLKVSK